MRERICSCGKKMIVKSEELIREINGKKTTIKDVPVLYCENCREILYKAKTIKRIDELLKAYPDEDIVLFEEFPATMNSINMEVIRKLNLIIEEYNDDMDKPVSYANLISMISHLKKHTA